MKLLLTLSILLQGCFMVGTSASSYLCLASDPGDSEAFGHALAVNENYLAVGDPKANRVVLYERDAREGWIRLREILPPQGSIADQLVGGFGHSLDWNQNTLAIGTYDWLTWTQWKPKQANDNFGAIYTAKIHGDRDIVVQEMSIPPANLVMGYGVSFFGNQVAFPSITLTPANQGIQRILVVDPKTDRITRVIGAPQTPEEVTTWPQLESPPSVDFDGFGSSVDGNNNSLLIGATGLSNPEKTALRGGIYLATLEGAVQQIEFDGEGLASPQVSTAGSSVVLTDRLIGIGRLVPFGIGDTLLLRYLPDTGWSYVGAVALSGSLHAQGDQVLISLSRIAGMPSHSPPGHLRIEPDHLLVRVDAGQVVIESKIRWNRNYHVPANGVIDSEHLILSAEGQVVQIHIASLTNPYLIGSCP
ncbi:MAG: hypothetical protein HC899_31700 [Leptolyngbyaceae cyanobacterium SM1_4_3]|nr:hypothetical protein [Leptolyngbyaceae cyanobacterium SM1_4_3]